MSELSMEAILHEYLAMADNDIKGASEDFLRAKRYIKESSATFTRGQLLFLGAPKMLTKQAFEVFQNACNTIYSILDKVITKYITDKDYQSIFPFSEELKQLILLPCGYNNKLPVARIDIFFNEKDYSFKFCEFNADGASAMNEDRELYNAWTTTNLFKEFSKRYSIKNFELFDSFVVEFLSLYDEYLLSKNKANHMPNVAIIDFLGIGTKSEFEVFKSAFEKKGCHTVIEDITNLKYKDGKLYDSKGNVIDAIYRRAVTSECMQRYNEIGDFLQAVRDGAVCLIGGFRTQVIHDKTIFNILRQEQTKQFLTYEENEFVEKHIPKTYLLVKGMFDFSDAIKNKNNYLIKPSDRYGSEGVAPGVSFSREKWQALLESVMDKDYILQEYCTPYKARNYFFNDSSEIVNGQYNNMTGMFVYCGKLKGLYTRSMLGAVTTKQAEGRVIPTVVIEKK